MITEKYFTINLKEIDKLKNLTKGENNVLIEFLKLANEDNKVLLNPTVRENLSNALGMPRQSIAKTISSLNRNTELISLVNKEVYLVNPSIFSKMQLY